MKRFLLTTTLLFLVHFLTAQAYIKLEVDRGDSLNTCDNTVDLIKYGTADGPYVITWWDNSWSPSSGFHAQNICEGKGLTVELIDTNCNHLRTYIRVLPQSVQQVYVDTVIAVMPSAPGMCDGSLSFFFANVQSGDTKTFSSSGSGGQTSSTVFNGLCEDYYNYGIWRNGGLICEVTVSLNYLPMAPCIPHKDSLIIAPQSSPGSCDASVVYNSKYLNGGTTLFHHSIYQPVGGGSVQVNSDSALSYTGLCAGPYIVRTEDHITNNQYFMETKIFIDEPLLQDSIWGSPVSSQIDTILLNALTNCAIDYSFNVDSVYINNMTYIGANQYEFEIAVIQASDTLYSYQTAIADTSKQLCFDLTFFCADSSGFGTLKSGGNSQLHNYIYFKNGNGLTTQIDNVENGESFELYPIPADKKIVIENLLKGKNEIRIYAIDGTLIDSKMISNTKTELDVTNWKNAIYIIQILNETANSSYFKKVVISHQ